eukprot:357663-Chlamydomonas_euryale.AAC.20
MTYSNLGCTVSLIHDVGDTLTPTDKIVMMTPTQPVHDKWNSVSGKQTSRSQTSVAISRA